MHAYLKIGDTSISIQPVQAEPGDDRHQIIVADAWNAVDLVGKEDVHPARIAQSEVVNTEGDAIRVLVDFLEIEGPGDEFLKLFPLHAP